MRTEMIKKVAEDRGISVRTVKNYLCQYLAFQSISALVRKEGSVPERGLNEDEKNIRWALNKFYFTRHSLKKKLIVDAIRQRNKSKRIFMAD